MAKWRTQSSKEMFANPWFSVRQDQVLDHRGKELTYNVVKMAHPAVYVVAMNAAGEVLLQRNYRYPVDRTMWELPAGHSEGQGLLAAAKRELVEEAGLESDDWSELGRFYQADGIADLPGVCFLARDVRASEGERDEAEDISDQRFVALGEIERMIRDGEIECAPLVVGMMLVRVKLAI